MKRLFQNSLVMVWLDTFTRFGMALIVLPIALFKLSDGELSIWLFFNSLLSMAMLADSGLSPTLLRATAYFKVGTKRLPLSFAEQSEKATAGQQPNWESVRVLIITSRKMYVFIGIATLLLLLVVGGASVWNLMSLEGHQPRYWLAFLILVVWGTLQVQLIRWSGILQGLGRVVEAKRLDSAAGLIKIILFSAVLFLNQGVLGISCVGLVVVIFTLYFMRRAVLRQIPPTPDVKEEFDWELFHTIWPSTWRLGLVGLGAFGVSHGTALVIAQLSDTKIIASYLLTLRVVILLTQIASAPLVAYLPNIVSTLAQRDFVKFRIWTIRVICIALLIFLSGSVFLAVAGNWLLAILHMKFTLVPMTVLLLLLFAYFLETHHSIHASLYIATNHVPFLWPSLISGATIVGIGMIVVKPYGMIGVVIVQILVQALCNNWYPVYLSLGISKWTFGDYLKSLILAPIQFARGNRSAL